MTARVPPRSRHCCANAGFGPSRLSVLEHLGGEAERRIDGIANDWNDPPIADLNLIAIECIAEAERAAPVATGRPAGLRLQARRPTDQTRCARHHPRPSGPGPRRAVVGCRCRQWLDRHRMDARSSQLSGAGHREADEGRQRLIEHNRDALGVPGLQLVRGSAPQALAGLERPDAIFIGGGVTREGVLDACWAAAQARWPADCQCGHPAK